MEPESITDKLNRIYNKHKGSLEGMFHSMLWLIMVDGRFKNEKVAFTAQYKDDYLSLGVALNTGGWIPTVAFFKEEIKLDEAKKICNDLNREIFGLNLKQTMNLMIESMRKKPLTLSKAKAN